MAGHERLAQMHLSAGFADFGLNQRFHMLHKQTTSVKCCFNIIPMFQINNCQKNSTRLEPSRNWTSDCAPGKLPTRWEVAAPPRETLRTPHETIIHDHIWCIIWFRLSACPPLKQNSFLVWQHFPCICNYMKRVLRNKVI